MKRFLFRWLYRLSWIPAAIGLLLLCPMCLLAMCLLENAVAPEDRL